jgi:hypothetical protein
MKTKIQNSRALLAVMMCFILASFDMKPGSHSFQVFLDDRLVIERYARADMEAPTIDISGQHKTIDVRYSECGRTVSGRKLTLKDSNNNVLKIWQYDGTSSGLTDAMACPVRDIVAIAKERGTTFRLSYSSNDFPAGFHIVTVKVTMEKLPG